MYAAVSKLAAIAEQAPGVDLAEIDSLVKAIIADDDQYISAREVSKMPNGPSYATLARWRLRGTGPDYLKHPNSGRILYRKGDFKPKKMEAA